VLAGCDDGLLAVVLDAVSHLDPGDWGMVARAWPGGRPMPPALVDAVLDLANAVPVGAWTNPVAESLSWQPLTRVVAGADVGSGLVFAVRVDALDQFDGDKGADAGQPVREERELAPELHSDRFGAVGARASASQGSRQSVARLPARLFGGAQRLITDGLEPNRGGVRCLARVGSGPVAAGGPGFRRPEYRHHTCQRGGAINGHGANRQKRHRGRDLDSDRGRSRRCNS
jgi:hypothetical protein